MRLPVLPDCRSGVKAAGHGKGPPPERVPLHDRALGLVGSLMLLWINSLGRRRQTWTAHGLRRRLARSIICDPELLDWCARITTRSGSRTMPATSSWGRGLPQLNGGRLSESQQPAPLSPGYVVDSDVDVIELRAGQPRCLAAHDCSDGVGDAMKGRSEGHDEPYGQVYAVGQRRVMLFHSG